MKSKLIGQLTTMSKFMAYGWLLQLFFTSILIASDGMAQKPESIEKIQMSIQFEKAMLEEVFSYIAGQTQLKFAYEHSNVDVRQKVTVKAKETTLGNILRELSKNYDLKFLRINDNIFVSKKEGGDRVEERLSVQHQVRGKVTALSSGEGLPGVNVLVKGSSIGTVTDVDGNYSLNVPSATDTLIFSSIGYVQEEIPVNNQSTLDVQLAEDIRSLEEIVVIGYGTQQRSSVTGAVDQVSSEALEGRPVVNLTDALQGVSANLIIQQPNSEPGAGINLNIRGISTLGNNSPLVVIDGVVGGDINLLNPSDIKNISVLKDAGSAAIYGSRANNGVILITTKKGSKDTRPQVTFNGLAGINYPHFFIKPVHGYENAMLRNESALNAGQTSAVYTPEEIRQFRENGDETWFADEILQPAWQQNHNLAVSGGGERSTYYISAGYLDQQSNFVGPAKGIKRYNFRLNMTNELGKLKLTSILSYARRLNTDHSFSTGTLMVDASRVPLIYAQKDSLGRYLTNDVLQEFNSLGILEQGGFRRYDDDHVYGNVTAEFAITDFLKLRGVFGGNLYANHLFARTLQVDFFPQGVYGANRNTYDESRKSLDLNSQLMADFTKTFNGEHDINILLGVSNENHTDRGTGIYKIFTDPELGTPVTETVIEPNSYTSNQSASENSLNSAFGRASYAYHDKYYGEFSFRYDGSSRFAKNNRWGFFPSVSVGYRLSEESFLSSYRDHVGNVKVRASYGVLGNQNVGNYQYQTTYFTFQNAYGFNNVPVSGAGYNFANPDIRWESAATFNVGADLDFFNGALTLSLDYFNKVTSDILIPPAVPGVFGTSLPDFNAGKVGSKGWEIVASYVHLGKGVDHRISFNLGDSRNEVLDFQGEERLTGVEELQILLKEGYPYHSYVGLQREGYFQTIDEIESAAKPEGLTNLFPGDNRYVDVNEDGVIDDDDKVVFGNPFPRFTFGANYNVSFKGFDLSIFLQGVGKRTMMIRGETVEPFHFNYGMTMYTHQLDYWTPQNPDARYPRLSDNGSQSNTNNFRRGSDMYLFDAAYLRVKNVQLGYTLPAAFARKLGMQNFRVYLSGKNLFTLSDVKFVDPELTEFNNNLQNSGANSARAYPTMIYYGFGVDVTF